MKESVLGHIPEIHYPKSDKLLFGLHYSRFDDETEKMSVGEQIPEISSHISL